MKDPQKTEASKLAAEFAVGTSADILRLKQLLAAQDSGNAAAALSPPPQSSGLDDERPVRIRDGWVGIWEPAPQQGEAAFTRSAEFADEWALWAKQPVIPPKSNARRIVLLGESVARGFLYDPVYTPARSLAGMLAASPLPWQTEVVDLARTSLKAADLISLLHASVRLQPDAILVFAGNNWREDSRPRTPEACRAAATILRKDGVAGLRRHLEDGLEHLVEGYTRQFEEFASETRIPVVFLIPEFNLEDWRPEEPLLAPLLPAERHRDWLAHMRLAALALEQGDLAAAETEAGLAIEMDQGAAMGSARLLADCRLRQGRLDEARSLLEQARDANIWDASIQSPRAPDIVIRSLRRMAERGIVKGVDLPQVFAGHTEGRPPGREIFLDYCHYSAEGIRMAMAAAAEALLPLMGGPPISRSVMAPLDPGPSARVAAEACFAAAIHNAHWGQPRELVAYFCRRALECSPHMAAILALYAEIQIRKAPLWMCRQTEQLGGLCTEAMSRYVLLYATASTGRKLLDRRLLDAIGAALEEAGAPENPELQRLLIEEYGAVRQQHVDLLDATYAPSWSHPDWYLFHHWPDAARRHYYRAHTPESRFVFVADANAPLRLTLTVRGIADRLPAHDAVMLDVNGSGLASINIEAAWRTHTLAVPGALLKPGMNTIRIRWPDGGSGGFPGEREAAADWLESGCFPSLLTPYGEIHSMTISKDQEHTAHSTSCSSTGRWDTLVDENPGIKYARTELTLPDQVPEGAGEGVCPPVLDLPGHEVHVYRAQMSVWEPHLARLTRVLDEQELGKAGRFHFQADSSRYAITRALLRCILGQRYLGEPPGQVVFDTGDWGKPSLRRPAQCAPLFFNVAHSGDFSLIAVARCEVGVDVERVRVNMEWEELVPRVFSDAEQEALRQTSPDQRFSCFFTTWARKEACLKARGNGLSIDPRSITVSVGAGSCAGLSHVSFDPAETDRWTIRDIRVAPDYVAAVTAAGHDWQLRLNDAAP